MHSTIQPNHDGMLNQYLAALDEHDYIESRAVQIEEDSGLSGIIDSLSLEAQDEIRQAIYDHAAELIAKERAEVISERQAEERYWRDNPDY